MSASPARAAAFEILLRVEREQSYASELLHSARTAVLSPADHGLCTELTMGVLRWRSWLDTRVAEASSQKLERLDLEVLTALRLGVYQMTFLSRVPARAAIFESVELVKAARKRSAAGFANAVLRKVAANTSAGNRQNDSESGSLNLTQDAFSGIESSTAPDSLARDSAHPEWLVKRWAERYGMEKARQICLYDQHPPRISVRIDSDECLGQLAGESIALKPGALLTRARTVVSGDVARMRERRAGGVAIQDEGSQLVALLTGRGSKILDCCAAPGGKTALLARHNPSATIFASELHPHRAHLLRDLTRLPNVRVVAADARQLPFAGGFDRVLGDVPCSGTGTLARNPEIKWQLTKEDLGDLQVRQIGILKGALAQLARRGRLVYSTCSLESEENEAVVEAVLKETPGFSVIDCRRGLEELQRAGELTFPDIEALCAGPYLRTIPGVHACDGFFAAMIERG